MIQYHDRVTDAVVSLLQSVHDTVRRILGDLDEQARVRPSCAVLCTARAAVMLLLRTEGTMRPSAPA